MKNKNWIDEWVTQYGTEGKLPSKTIPCSTEGCETMTTCFSTNLSGRITSTEGGLPTLLRTFKCRGCRSKTSGGLEKPKRERVAKAAKKTTTKKAARDSRVETLKEAARASTVDVNSVPVRYNFNDPEQVRQLTENTCQRPDIYLNNDRACDGCVLYENCACSAKQLLADTGRKLTSSGPKRKK
jgi:hypothetical protein